MLIFLVTATFVPNYSVTLSAFTKFDLGLDETKFGYLMSCVGVGAIFGAIFIATIDTLSFKKMQIFAFATCILSAFTGIFANFYYACFMLVLLGFIFVATVASSNSILQLNVDDEYRGRVMSFYTLAFQGSTPFGALFAGYFTQNFGAKFGFLACGFCASLILILMFIKFKHSQK